MSSARTNVRLLLSSNSCSCQAKFEHLFDMGREDALMARKITKRQQQIYDFIKEYQQEKGYPPSVREMASAVGLSSPSTVHAHLCHRRAGYSSAMPPNHVLWNSLTRTVPLSQFLNLTSPPHLAERSRYRSLVASRLGFPFWPNRISKTLLLSRPKSPPIRVPLSLRCMGAQ